MFTQDTACCTVRGENKLGFKMVKRMMAVGFVHDCAGQGGYNEDHEFHDYRMPI